MNSLVRQLWSSWIQLTARFGDFQARWILTVFYFTVALPFGLLTRVALDQLHTRHAPPTSGWLARGSREDCDLASARREF